MALPNSSNLRSKLVINVMTCTEYSIFKTASVTK